MPRENTPGHNTDCVGPTTAEQDTHASQERHNQPREGDVGHRKGEAAVNIYTSHQQSSLLVASGRCMARQ
eukprot:2472630-Alexandrium_andersonii.AAC.1